MEAAGDLARKELDRVYWHSRRGMLELDLVLMPFAREVYPYLNATLRSRYRALLSREDADLYRWLVAGQVPEQEQLTDIVARVIAHGHDRTKT